MVQVGIDISKAKFDACVLSTDSRATTKEFQNNATGFQKLEPWLRRFPKEDIHFCMEATGRLWEPLAEYLEERGYAVSVVNPVQVKGFATSEMKRSKSDAIDAGIIARFCRALNPPKWVAPPPRVKAVRDMERNIDALKTARAREYNRIQSGILNDDVRASIMRHLDFLDAEVSMLEKEQKRQLKTVKEIAEKYDLLCSIIGVGHVTAITILGEVGTIERFASSRELEQFSGLAPRIKRSGSSIRGRTCISKKGNARIRKALYMASLSARKHNPQLRDFADRLKAANKPNKVILCAVMRKLLRIVFAVLRSARPFDPDYRSTKPALLTA